MTAEPTASPEPLNPADALYRPWLELVLDEGHGGVDPNEVPTGAPPEPTEAPLTEGPPPEPPPTDGPPGVDGGTLQVFEPPPSMGLLDTIVGDVVASYLGK